MLIHEKKYYVFEGNATVKNLTKFAKREYNKLQQNEIKPAKQFWEKVWFTASVNLASFRPTLDRLGFDFLPQSLQDVATVLFLCAPILAVLLVIYLTQESDVVQEPSASTEPKATIVQPCLIEKRKRE